LDAIAVKHPRAHLPATLAVRALAASSPVDESALRARIDPIARKMLRKGVAAMLRGLLGAVGAALLPLLDTMAGEYVAVLRDTGRFDATSEEEPASTLFWALFMHARAAYERGDHAEALKRLDAAHAHTPTSIDVASLRAKTHKRAGNATLAYQAAEAARDMDHADRYLNNKAAKYALRDGRREEAVRLISMFTRGHSDAEAYMHELQVSWFELESGEAALRDDDYGAALHYFRWVDRSCDSMESTQSDFFGYSFRKVCLCSSWFYF